MGRPPTLTFLQGKRRREQELRRVRLRLQAARNCVYCYFFKSPPQQAAGGAPSTPASPVQVAASGDGARVPGRFRSRGGGAGEVRHQVGKGLRPGRPAAGPGVEGSGAGNRPWVLSAGIVSGDAGWLPCDAGQS